MKHLNNAAAAAIVATSLFTASAEAQGSKDFSVQIKDETCTLSGPPQKDCQPIQTAERAQKLCNKAIEQKDYKSYKQFCPE